MKSVHLMEIMTILLFSVSVSADQRPEHKLIKYDRIEQKFDYAKVLDVEPVYRQVQVTDPVRECWNEPAYQRQQGYPKSAGGMLVGGLLGGVIGHQLGKGGGNRIATAVGTIIGAQIGHQAVNGDDSNDHQRVIDYQQHCQLNHTTSYAEVIDGYHVIYRFRGQRHQIEMPYDPGERIKMRIQFSPVI